MSDNPNAGLRAEMKGIYAEIWNKAHAAGREAGMREAVALLEAYAVNSTYAGQLGATRIVAVDHAIKAILSTIKNAG